MTLKEAIQILANTGAEIYSKICVVDSVNETARTVDCSPIDEGAPILSVNLQANQEGEEGLVIIPKQGSYVIVTFLGQSTAFVSLTDEVEKVLVRIGERTLKIDKDTIDFNDGTLGGLVIVGDLVKKLNAIENDLNSLKGIFSGWVTVPNDGGAALKGASAAWAGSQLTITQIKDIENDKVNH